MLSIFAIFLFSLPLLLLLNTQEEKKNVHLVWISTLLCTLVSFLSNYSHTHTQRKGNHMTFVDPIALYCVFPWAICLSSSRDDHTMISEEIRQSFMQTLHLLYTHFFLLSLFLSFFSFDTLSQLHERKKRKKNARTHLTLASFRQKTER